MISLKTKDLIKPALRKKARTLRKTGFAPAMQQIEREIIEPVAVKKWNRSGLKSQSRELEKSIKTWHGKTSVGVSIKSNDGQDLVAAKATTHTRGAAKGSSGKNKKYRVRAYTRGGQAVRKHTKKTVVAPWGDVAARPFLPVASDLGVSDQKRIAKIIEEYVEDA